SLDNPQRGLAVTFPTGAKQHSAIMDGAPNLMTCRMFVFGITRFDDGLAGSVIHYVTLYTRLEDSRRSHNRRPYRIEGVLNRLRDTGFAFGLQVPRPLNI